MTTPLATAADLAALPNDGFRYYLIRGEIRKRKIASYAYGIVTGRLAFPLLNLAEKEQLGVATVGECGYRLRRDPDTVLDPAAAFIANDVLPPFDERDFTTHVCIPTLAIEVVSPSNTRREVMEKVEAYREAGVRLIWVAFPETKSVLVDGAGREPVILTEHDLLDGGEVLPALRPLRVADIFR
ncbi:MAG: Uma2 family endonuclease [Thermomicrobiales bacterium]